MNPNQIQQKVFYGYAKAASKLGALFNLYRSSTPLDPIANGNLITTTRMSRSVSWDYMKANKYNNMVFNACLDAQSANFPNSCQIGDYLVPTADVYAVSYSAASIAIVSGGANYAVGDFVILNGGLPLAYIVLEVLTVNGSGAITTAAIDQSGSYNYPLPSNPLSQNYTTGSGTGATFNVTWDGSGVIEDNFTYFVQSLQFDLPPQVVQCNRTLSVIRPSQNTGPGYIGYAGYTEATSEIIMTNMPAAVIRGSRGESAPSKLPTDTREPAWLIFLPNLGNVSLRIGDIISDELDEEYVITLNELTELGWRLEALQVVNSR